MQTTLYLSFYHANSITMLYMVHKYKKKLKKQIYTYEFYTFANSDFTCQLGGYGCATIHKIVHSTISCKYRVWEGFGHT